MKKFNLRSVSDFLSDEQLKRIPGGLEGCYRIVCKSGEHYYVSECPDVINGVFCEDGGCWSC